MYENRNLFLFLIEINNMHRARHILPVPRSPIWRRCGRCGQCGVSWHRLRILQRPLIFTLAQLALPYHTLSLFTHTHIWLNTSIVFL